MWKINTIIIILQRVAPSKTTTFASVAATNQKKLSKIKASVELKLFINSLVIFLVMVVKASLFMRGSYGLDDLFNISFTTLNYYVSDLFSLSSPFILVCTSDIARSAMFSALKGKRYSPMKWLSFVIAINMFILKLLFVNAKVLSPYETNICIFKSLKLKRANDLILLT
jgi:hypothetical protein